MKKPSMSLLPIHLGRFMQTSYWLARQTHERDCGRSPLEMKLRRAPVARPRAFY
jgi:hypothetical protein